MVPAVTARPPHIASVHSPLPSHMHAAGGCSAGARSEWAVRRPWCLIWQCCVPTKQVYAGMLIGECARENDMEVNPVREKKLTNVRAANNDDKARALSVRHFGK